MNYPVFSVRDLLNGFMSPTVDLSVESSKRNFAFAVNSEANNIVSFRPQDYDLYQIGYFNTDTGVFNSFDLPELVCHGTDLIGVGSDA